MFLRDQTPQTVNLADISIPVNAAIRRMGYPSGTMEITGEVRKILDEEVKRAKGLISPRGIYRILEIISRDNGRIQFKGTGFFIESRQVLKMLRGCDIVSVFMVTIGPALEEEVGRLCDSNETTRGFILDAVGSETADEAADRMHHHVLKALAKKNGYSVTPRFSPGYGDWPVVVQRDLAKVCSGKSIGIGVTESSLMIPRKSVSAVIGLIQKR